MPPVIQLSRPMAGPLYVSAAAIAVISPARFSEAWQGIRARVQLMDGRWYRVSQCPEEIISAIGTGPQAGQAIRARGGRDGAERAINQA